MITKINDIDIKVLSLFTQGYNKGLYIREVEKLLEISSRTALITLDKLEKRGILESKLIGKTKVYNIKKTIISREYFLLTEQYKKIHFLESNLVIKEIIEKLSNILNGIVVLFGSYAKGLQNEESDLDLFIVGKLDENKIRKVGRTYGIEINIKRYPMSIFEMEINEDILLKEIADNHIIISDAETFVRKVAKWT